MLRIATVYEHRLGRNDGNPLYVTACLKRMQYYMGVLSGLGPNQELLGFFADGKDDPMALASAKKLFEATKDHFEVDHLIPNGDLKPYGTYDLAIDTDWGEDGLTGFLPYTPVVPFKPLAVWNSDTHINNGLAGDSYPYRLEKSKKADFVFVAQKSAVEKMKKDGVANPIWLPHAVEPQAYPKFDLLSKKYDLCFVGHVNNQLREDALDRMFREFPNFYYGQALFEEAARKYAESKVCFNIAMTDDVNMRNFEIMATGSLLLTSYLPDFEDLGLIDGKHLVLYKTLDEAVEKVKYYIEHEDERTAIAQAGYEHTIKNHTIQHRVNVILNEFLKSRQPKEAPSESMLQVS